MKETSIKVDYAKIDSYKLSKMNYSVKKFPYERDSELQEMLRITCDINYSCFYENKLVNRGAKQFILYIGIEIPDTEWMFGLQDKLLLFRGIIKKEVAGFPE